MSKIQWTDVTWNPITGCTKVSPGCKHCYAERMAKRLKAMGRPEYQDVVDESGWTGTVNLVPSRLEKPYDWAKPSRIFVCSMSDLFHPDVPDEFINSVFDVMTQTKRHTFQVLTKRPERMENYVRQHWPHLAQRYPHIALGVSVENMDQAEKRIPHLTRTPAGTRFLSCEPLIAPVGISLWLESLSWVIVGGESGPRARPCHVEWIAMLVETAQSRGIPVFVKQLGRYPIAGIKQSTWPDGTQFGNPTKVSELDGLVALLKDRKGGNPEEWPAALRIRQF